MTIISLVSQWNRAGKGHASEAICKVYRSSFEPASFTWNLYKAARTFLGPAEGRDKYTAHPGLGVSEKTLVNELAKALGPLHQELSVWRVKRDIEWYLRNAYSVVIDDVRRQREFVWLDELTMHYGTKHHIIEIVPGGMVLRNTRPDTWTNGEEPCGYAAWSNRERTVMENNGTDAFDAAVVRVVETLLVS